MEGVPAGCVRVAAGRRTAVALAAHADDARTMLARGSLYEVASRDRQGRPLAGRGIAYAITLPVSGVRAVVRHNRHGGLLASVTRDLFFPPTRAPHELRIALRLATLGVPTPPVLCYGLEPAGILFQRADVVTREIVDSRDLATYMATEVPADERSAAWEATRALVRAMNDAGVRHHDLNVKNVLLARSGDALVAYLLDVDRVEIGAPKSADIARGNAARLLRSARKWRDERGAQFDEREIAALGTLVDSAR